MPLLKKKKTLVHHIAYMGIMASINMIFAVLDTYLPFGTFLLILILPFVSTIVSYFCLKRYYIIYAVASFGLCTIFSLSSAIFYIIPALTTGFVIGVLLEKKIHPFWIILSCSFIEAGFTYAFIPLIKLLSGVNYIDTIITLLGLSEYAYREEVGNLIIFLIALIQCSLAHFVLINEINKIGIEINTRVNSFLPYICGLLISLIIAFTLAFLYRPLAFVFVMISFIFGAFLFADIIVSHKLPIYLTLGALFLLSFFTFSAYYTKIEKPYGLMLLSLYPLSVAVTSFINNYLIKKK